MKPELVLDIRLDLGEGPSWDERAGLLYFLDIHAGHLHIYKPSEDSHQVTSLNEPSGCLAPMQGGVILALRSGIYSFDLADLKKTLLFTPEPHLPGNRFNDGKCDPTGRFLAGTMDDNEQEASGSLYSLSVLGASRTLLTGLSISNGLTWSPDHQKFYFIDTPTRQVVEYQYDLSTGEIRNPRLAVTVPEDLGWPDGMTSDMEGMLWIAMWGGAQVTRWDPATGKMLSAFPVPAPNTTSCIFGGPHLGDLYITTARKGLSPSQLEEFPQSGGLFRFQTGTTGLQTFTYGG